MAKKTTLTIHAMRDETLDRFFELARRSARFRARIVKKFGTKPAPRLVKVLGGKHQDNKLLVLISASDELKAFMA